QNTLLVRVVGPAEQSQRDLEDIFGEQTPGTVVAPSPSSKGASSPTSAKRGVLIEEGSAQLATGSSASSRLIARGEKTVSIGGPQQLQGPSEDSQQVEDLSFPSLLADLRAFWNTRNTIAFGGEDRPRKAPSAKVVDDDDSDEDEEEEVEEQEEEEELVVAVDGRQEVVDLESGSRSSGQLACVPHPEDRNPAFRKAKRRLVEREGSGSADQQPVIVRGHSSSREHASSSTSDKTRSSTIATSTSCGIPPGEMGTRAAIVCLLKLFFCSGILFLPK
ncbi:unnamed protein product, partial [Amoebophrya sp. A25]